MGEEAALAAGLTALQFDQWQRDQEALARELNLEYGEAGARDLEGVIREIERKVLKGDHLQIPGELQKNPLLWLERVTTLTQDQMRFFLSDKETTHPVEIYLKRVLELGGYEGDVDGLIRSIGGSRRISNSANQAEMGRAASLFSTIASLFSSTLNSSKLTLTLMSFLMRRISDSIRALLSSSFATLESIFETFSSNFWSWDWVRVWPSLSSKNPEERNLRVSSALANLWSTFSNRLSIFKNSLLVSSNPRSMRSLSPESPSPKTLNWLLISSMMTELYRWVSSGVGIGFGVFLSFMRKILESSPRQVKSIYGEAFGSASSLGLASGYYQFLKRWGFSDRAIAWFSGTEEILFSLMMIEGISLALHYLFGVDRSMGRYVGSWGSALMFPLFHPEVKRWVRENGKLELKGARATWKDWGWLFVIALGLRQAYVVLVGGLTAFGPLIAIGAALGLVGLAHSFYDAVIAQKISKPLAMAGKGVGEISVDSLLKELKDILPWPIHYRVDENQVRTWLQIAHEGGSQSLLEQLRRFTNESEIRAAIIGSSEAKAQALFQIFINAGIPEPILSPVEEPVKISTTATSNGVPIAMVQVNPQAYAVHVVVQADLQGRITADHDTQTFTYTGPGGVRTNDPKEVVKHLRSDEEAVKVFEAEHPDLHVIAFADNACLFFNQGFVTFTQGQLFHIDSENPTAHSYSSLVIKKDGKVEMGEVTYSQQDARIQVLMAGQDITDEVEGVTFGQFLLEGGGNPRKDIENIIPQFQDLRHVFQLPRIFIKDISDVQGEIVSRGEVYFGVSELSENDYASAKEAWIHAIHLSLKVKVGLRVGDRIEFQEKAVSQEVLRKLLEKMGYQEKEAGAVRRKGEFAFKGNGIDIFLKEGVYPRTVVGVTQDGSFVLLGNGGKSGREGTTLGEIAQLAAEKGCVQAMLLDHGGNAKIFANGSYLLSPGFMRGAAPSKILITKKKEIFSFESWAKEKITGGLSLKEWMESQTVYDILWTLGRGTRSFAVSENDLSVLDAALVELMIQVKHPDLIEQAKAFQAKAQRLSLGLETRRLLAEEGLDQTVRNVEQELEGKVERGEFQKGLVTLDFSSDVTWSIRQDTKGALSEMEIGEMTEQLNSETLGVTHVQVSRPKDLSLALAYLMGLKTKLRHFQKKVLGALKPSADQKPVCLFPDMDLLVQSLGGLSPTEFIKESGTENRKMVFVERKRSREEFDALCKEHHIPQDRVLFLTDLNEQDARAAVDTKVRELFQGKEVEKWLLGHRENRNLYEPIQGLFDKFMYGQEMVSVMAAICYGDAEAMTRALLQHGFKADELKGLLVDLGEHQVTPFTSVSHWRDRMQKFRETTEMTEKSM
ncbi:MAG: phosphodiester glycosidase family protein [Chlamydiae bacterium]|nr:phosphodiester glycosidase family protein [Chlamydiota bacterium]MBI3266898.1 phosphodiester glycosidase family protein [Chlamydiota bacterium]